MSKSDRFPSWKPYEHSKALAHRLKEYGIWKSLRAWTNTHMNYLEPSLSYHGTILTIHTAVNVIVGAMKRYYNKSDIAQVILETIKLAVRGLFVSDMLFLCTAIIHCHQQFLENLDTRLDSLNDFNHMCSWCLWRKFEPILILFLIFVWSVVFFLFDFLRSLVHRAVHSVH